MFAIIAITSVSGAILGIAAHYVAFGRRRADVTVDARRLPRWSGWQLCVHGLAALSFVILSVTGFASAFWFDEFEGWWLWLHLLAAPVFSISLAVLAPVWAESCRFAAHDAAWLRAGGGYFSVVENPPADKFDAGQKLFFWSVLTLGFLVLASMMAAMVPVFGQDAAAVLHALHRYSALGLLVAVILHTYATILAKPGAWRAMIWGYVSAGWARRYHRLWWSRLCAEQGE